MVSLQERPVHARALFSRSERGSYARDHWSVFGVSLQPIAAFPELTKDQGDWDGQEGKLDARVLTPLYSGADRCFREWKDLVRDSFACNYEDHPDTLRRGSDVIAVGLAALPRWRSTGILRGCSESSTPKGRMTNCIGKVWQLSRSSRDRATLAT